MLATTLAFSAITKFLVGTAVALIATEILIPSKKTTSDDADKPYDYYKTYNAFRYMAIENVPAALQRVGYFNSLDIEYLVAPNHQEYIARRIQEKAAKMGRDIIPY
ncbi:MAG: hypothetical protein RR922_06015 [Clostridia bacterium]